METTTKLHPPLFSAAETERDRLARITEHLIATAIAETPNGRGWGCQGEVHPLFLSLEPHPMWRPLSEGNNSQAPYVFGFLLGTTPVMAERLIPNIVEVTNMPELRAHVFPEKSRASPLRTPIQHAVSAFALGHWLTVIILAGTTSELLTVLLYQLALPNVRKRFADLSIEQKQLVVSSKKFAELGQQDRILRLVKLEIIDESISSVLGSIRQTRNLYVHPSRGIRHPEHVQKSEATIMLQKTCKLVQDCLIVGATKHQMDLWNPLFFEDMRTKDLISISTMTPPTRIQS